MSLSLSSLLNPSAETGSRLQSESLPPKDSLPTMQHDGSIEDQHAQSPTSSRTNLQQVSHDPPTVQEAARALATLSASPVPTPTQWNGYVQQDQNTLDRVHSWDAQQSSYGEPMQLPPPNAQAASRKMSSPTLEQYQVASRSPEQRRASLASQSQSSITLPPIHNHVPPSDLAARMPQTSAHEGGPLLSAATALHAETLPDLAVETEHTRTPSEKHVTQLRVNEGAPTAQLKTPTSNLSTRADEEPSSPAEIKQEAVQTPQPSSPVEGRRPSEMDQHTLKAVASLKNEYGLRTQSPLRESSVPVPTTELATPEQQPVNPKKRAAPAKAKKGTASAVKKEKAPPSKRRKLEPKRSTTPSSRALKSTNVKGTSVKGTPANSSPAPSMRSNSAELNEEPYDEDDEDMEDDPDADVYCLCRKPDSGTFMIGCDGTCDDWFHGKCVGIEERDKNLMDKYVCPNCTKAGIGQTIWKRMCRRGGCRQPAKISKAKGGAYRGKYCSEECGMLFFRDMVARSRGQEETAKNRFSRRKTSLTLPDKSSADDDLGARGGVLSAGEIKALLEVSNTAEQFRRLGDGVLSPPATPGVEDKNIVNRFSESETQDLDRIQVEKEHARSRHSLLKDRMKFISLAKQNASRIATEKELKPKEYCGYDPRLEWTEDRFQAWRKSDAGQHAFEQDMLQNQASVDHEQAKADSDEHVEICERKKCARHVEWARLAVDDIRFEMADNGDRMRALDSKEKSIHERAALRARAGDLSGEGTVEIHDLGIVAHGVSNEKSDVGFPYPNAVTPDEPATAVTNGA